MCGTEHRRTGRTCQDAYAWQRCGRALVAVVADGCGSGRYSEVGATLGARLWTNAMSRAVVARGLDGRSSVTDAWLSIFVGEVWPQVRADVVRHLRGLAEAMGDALPRVVSDHFLFTVVGAVITPAVAVVFSIGDGAYAIDDSVQEIGPFAGNQPPYLGYDLLDNTAVHPLAVHACMATTTLDSIVLATDGATPLLRATEQAAAHATDNVSAHGSLTQFAQPRYVRNRDAIRRRLTLLNRERRELDPSAGRMRKSGGLFVDDVALVTIQRTADALVGAALGATN